MKDFEKDLKELIGVQDSLLNITNKLDYICGYSLLDYANEEDYINNESITASNSEYEYNVEFKIIEVAEKYLDYKIEVVDVYEL